MADSKQEEKSKAEEAREATGSPVPAGVQESPSASAGRRTHGVDGKPVPEDEQLLDP